ncbi:MAG: N-acetylglucosamine-6-phosphate deacetylase [Treponema sp.]|nr:N-acetylglucosamine-6-phosphate deacetylase [Treponema sp.]
MKLCIHNATVLNGISKMENCAILIDDKKIADIFSEARFAQKTFADDVAMIDARGMYVAPGLIDTHIHGFKGHGTDACTTEGILQMSADLAQYGVTAFTPTMYPAPEQAMIDSIKAIVQAMGKETGAKIMGIHLEGPFISPHKLGVQRLETVKEVDIDLMERLWEVSEGHIVNMTVAPELKDMRRLALSCIEKGIVLQAGHTDASYSNMVEGMQAGIFHATHFFNAMSQMHHRNPGAVGAVLIHAEMTCEVIADGIHIHPDLFKLLQKDKTSDKLVLVTDALSPTEVWTDRPLFANGEEVVFKGGCFHRKSDDVIAGSALTMIRGVKNLVSFGFPPCDAIKCAAANPARIMRFQKKGMLVPGYDSDVIVFDKDFAVQFVMVQGNIVKNNF